MSNTTKTTKKYNTRFTAGISPRKERKPGQVRISEMEEAHNADMRALEAAKKMHARLKKRCITIRIGDLTITGLPATVRHRLEYMGYTKQQIEETLCSVKRQ